jgi:hypothetical protein
MCITRPYGISYAHNTTFTEKNYEHNLSLDRKIYTQVILQLVVYTSCTHKSCTNQTYAENLCDKFYRFQIMHQSYVYKL